MTQSRFTNQISLGNVLQIVVLLVGLGAAWFAMDHRSQSNAEGLAKIQEDITNIDSEVGNDLEGLEARLRDVETELARSDERFSSILNLLSRIDDRLERIEDLK